MIQFVECALKTNSVKFEDSKSGSIIECSFERYKDSAVSENVSLATLSREYNRYSNAFPFNTLTSKDTKDSCFEGITQMSTTSAFPRITKHPRIVAFSIDSRSSTGTDDFLSLVVSSRLWWQLRINISSDQSLWSNERLMWMGLVILEAETTWRDFYIASFLKFSEARQSVHAFSLPALCDWTTEGDPLTITELFPFRRFLS